MEEIDKLSIDTLRLLGVEMINKANSGHPGIVLGAAPIIYSLFAHHLKFDPNFPNYYNRDRFVMSAGHGSALLYATLYMAGYPITLEDLNSLSLIDINLGILELSSNNIIFSPKFINIKFNSKNSTKLKSSLLDTFLTEEQYYFGQLLYGLLLSGRHAPLLQRRPPPGRPSVPGTSGAFRDRPSCLQVLRPPGYRILLLPQRLDGRQHHHAHKGHGARHVARAAGFRDLRALGVRQDTYARRRVLYLFRRR